MIESPGLEFPAPGPVQGMILVISHEQCWDDLPRGLLFGASCPGASSQPGCGQFGKVTPKTARLEPYSCGYGEVLFEIPWRSGPPLRVEAPLDNRYSCKFVPRTFHITG